ncbi:hypothetical protein [Kamptonema formosum]|uniref:hypothetical protein n=1 Tax=Kamptonema formosum TaxID=331992 RepID=UPI000346D2FF|nr:hypothetical protein [Oscillatoria sp. PCC 10802]
MSRLFFKIFWILPVGCAAPHTSGVGKTSRRSAAGSPTGIQQRNPSSPGKTGFSLNRLGRLAGFEVCWAAI